jgi:hypothetical protein
VSARRALEARARQDAGLDPSDDLPAGALRDYATTLLVALMRGQRFCAAQVGDGAIVVMAGDEIETVTVPDHGEYINESTFLSSADYLDRAQVVVRDSAEIEGIGLLSDGLQLLALDLQTGQAFAPFFRPLFRFAARPEADPSELRDFLASSRVCARTDDDKTLVLAVRSCPATDEPASSR